ncbi:hypothetical protein L195_g004426 [Trifolium pratense]|uniref:Uncharacterized protein n=1 Tax=Trifolium pratense TaxID=57577 RepID=A0A2K3NY09_TRIPR|nr:hypothetical protein L195_g004426 [Trifolium pratense]
MGNDRKSKRKNYSSQSESEDEKKSKRKRTVDDEERKNRKREKKDKKKDKKHSRDKSEKVNSGGNVAAQSLPAMASGLSEKKTIADTHWDFAGCGRVALWSGFRSASPFLMEKIEFWGWPLCTAIRD